MERPDDHLSEHIRDKLESFRPPYNPAAWDKLEKRLDTYAAVKPGIKFRSWLTGFLSGLIITMVGTALYFTLNDKDSSDLEPIYDELHELELEINQLKHEKSEIIYKSSQQNISWNINEKKNLELKLNSPKFNQTELFYISDSGIVNNNVSDQTEYMDSSQVLLNNNIEPVPVNYERFDKDSLIFSSVVFDINQCSKRKRKKFKWPQLGSLVNNNLYKNFVGPDKLFIDYNPGIEFGNYKDNLGIAQNVGVGVSGQLSPRLRIGLSVNYGNYSWSSDKEIGHNETQEIDSVIHASWVVDTLIHKEGSWEYLSVPINLSYQLFKFNNSSLHLNAGVSARFFLREKYRKTLTMLNEVEEDLNEYRAFTHNYFPARISLGLSYEYHFNEKWSLLASPGFSYSLQGMGANSLKYSSFNMSVRLSYKFRRND